MKEVVTTNEFGICPRCGRNLVMLQSEYRLYGLTEIGTYPNKLLKSQEDIQYACSCGYRSVRKRTMDGIYPSNYYKIIEEEERMAKGKDDIKVLGYIDED